VLLVAEEERGKRKEIEETHRLLSLRREGGRGEKAFRSIERATNCCCSAADKLEELEKIRPTDLVSSARHSL
jgi:hypothetical protein